MVSRLPLPPNRTGGSPASGSPVGGHLPQRGLTRFGVGCYQTLQPTFGKECVRPALMVRSSATSFQSPSSSEDTAQTHSYPAVDESESLWQAMLEVSKPARQRAIHIGDDLRQRVTVRTMSFLADGIFELVQTFLSRPMLQAL